MNGERFKEVYEATERSWESTAAQWMVVFDIVKQSREASLAPLEKAVWETYRQAQELRALVTGAWEQAQLQSRDEMRQQTFAAREAAELDLPVIPSPDPAVRPEPVVMPAAPLVMAPPAPVPPAPAPRP